MSKEYWEEFYKKHHDMTPSPFAAFCKKWITPKDRVIDVGCGNGRDTYFLNDYCKTDGVDEACLPELLETKFCKMSIKELVKKPSNYTVLYARFLFHAVEAEDIKDLLKWNKGLLCAEFRVLGDKPTVYPDHERNFIDSNALLNLIIVLGYDILFLEKGYGMARYKNEDPYVCRLIARRG